MVFLTFSPEVSPKRQKLEDSDITMAGSQNFNSENLPGPSSSISSSSNNTRKKAKVLSKLDYANIISEACESVIQTSLNEEFRNASFGFMKVSNSYDLGSITKNKVCDLLGIESPNPNPETLEDLFWAAVNSNSNRINDQEDEDDNQSQKSVSMLTQTQSMTDSFPSSFFHPINSEPSSPSSSSSLENIFGNSNSKGEDNESILTDMPIQQL